MKRIFLIALALVVAITALVIPAAVAGDPEEISMGISLYYRRDEWYKDLENMFYSKAADAGMRVDIQDADGDVARQAQQMEDFVSKKMRAVALAPASPDALIPVLQAASDKGVAVFIYDGFMDHPFVTGNVICDFSDNGRMNGEYIIDWVNQNKPDAEDVRVVILDFPASTSVGVPMIAKLNEVLAADGRFQVVAQQDGKADRNVAMSVMENILVAESNKVDIIFGSNDSVGLGALTACTNAGLTEVAAFAPGSWGEEAFTLLQNAGVYGYQGGSCNTPISMSNGLIDMVKKHFTDGLEQVGWNLTTGMMTPETVRAMDWQAILDARK